MRIWELKSGELLRQVELSALGSWRMAVSWQHNTVVLGNNMYGGLHSVKLLGSEAPTSVCGQRLADIMALLVDPAAQQLFVQTDNEILALQLPSFAVRASRSSQPFIRLAQRHGTVIASFGEPTAQLRNKRTLERLPCPPICPWALAAASHSKLFAIDHSLRVFDYSPTPWFIVIFFWSLLSSGLFFRAFFFQERKNQKKKSFIKFAVALQFESFGAHLCVDLARGKRQMLCFGNTAAQKQPSETGYMRHQFFQHRGTHALLQALLSVEHQDAQPRQLKAAEPGVEMPQISAQGHFLNGGAYWLLEQPSWQDISAERSS